MIDKVPTPIVVMWREYLRNKRAARVAAGHDGPNALHQRTVPPKRGKGSYNRRRKVDG